MKYLIVQDWSSTHGNHAGMVHMCNLLLDKYPSEYIAIINDIPRNRPSNTYYKKVINHIINLYDRYIYYPHVYNELCKEMFNNLNDSDEVFLLEYLYPYVSQLSIAKKIKKIKPSVKVYALSHLTPLLFEQEFSNCREMIMRWSKPINKMLTLGFSLSNYFLNCGINSNKISTGFHYVDDKYYHNDDVTRCNSTLRVIAMGNLQRDFKMLSNIVRATPYVNWVICKGRKQVDSLFTGMKNVTLKGYMEESELREEMRLADISFNVLEDTVGSNVITTSMAMGLALVVSDVGSIRDYCNENNAIFCKNSESDFISALKLLSENHDLVISMKKESQKKSTSLSIDNVHRWFCSLADS